MLLLLRTLHDTMCAATILDSCPAEPRTLPVPAGLFAGPEPFAAGEFVADYFGARCSRVAAVPAIGGECAAGGGEGAGAGAGAHQVAGPAGGAAGAAGAATGGACSGSVAGGPTQHHPDGGVSPAADHSYVFGLNEHFQIDPLLLPASLAWAVPSPLAATQRIAVRLRIIWHESYGMMGCKNDGGPQMARPARLPSNSGRWRASSTTGELALHHHSPTTLSSITSSGHDHDM